MEDYLVEVKKTEDGRDLLILSGRLTIENMDEIRLKLMQLVSTLSSSLAIVVEEVTNFDLSFLQLFESFRNFLKKQKVNFTFAWQMDEDQMKLLCGSGFSIYL
ncbi:MAG: hypothetical protein ABFD10_23140 [Prolixibacteraceae bacterium]